MPDCRNRRRSESRSWHLFEERFEYDRETDTYCCPAGNRLKPRSLHKSRQSRDYAASQKFVLLSIKKAVYQEQIGSDDQATSEAGRVRRDARSEPIRKSEADIKMRQHLMERSYARGTWYGFDRARWRGLWRVQIQEYLVSAVQNIKYC